MTGTSDNQGTGIICQILEVDPNFQPTAHEQNDMTRQDDATPSPPNNPSIKDVNGSDQAYAPPPPSTAGEAARLDVQHGLWAKTLGERLYISPLDKEQVHTVSYKPYSPIIILSLPSKALRICHF